MPLAAASLCSPLEPLRRDTFRDKSDGDFSLRVAHILAKAQGIVDAKAPTAQAGAKEAVVEALALGMAYEQAASIHAALATEEAIAGEVDLKYAGPVQLRKESERYLEKYVALLAALLDQSVKGPVRIGRLRRV